MPSTEKGHPIRTRRTLVSPPLPIGLPYLPLRSIKGLPDGFSLSTQLFPEHKLPVDRTNTPQRTRPHPPHRAQQGFTATTGRSASTPPRRYSLRCGSAAWQAPSRHPLDRGGRAGAGAGGPLSRLPGARAGTVAGHRQVVCPSRARAVSINRDAEARPRNDVRVISSPWR